jgi:hypothetical protein
MTQSLKEVLQEVETWPPDAQENLVSFVRHMGDSLKGGVYHPTPEEWAGIQRGLVDADAGRFATDAEVDELFAKYQS